mmetsp:Transcript_51045/g.84753  ORF Transcript_51045/g.84753 Transcript_51045/m.84753 type:complete len:81 (-) Transcript_51045:1-243(-)
MIFFLSRISLIPANGMQNATRFGPEKKECEPFVYYAEGIRGLSEMSVKTKKRERKERKRRIFAVKRKANVQNSMSNQNKR